MNSHLVLMDLLEEIAHLCHMNDVEFWADWGTILGHIRHNNVIPWDNDCDLCMLSKDYDKLLTIFKNANANTIGKLVCQPDAYNDTGCYWIRHRDYVQSDYGVDVVKYEITNRIVKNLMNDATLAKWPTVYPISYDYDYNDLFPLRKVLMVGTYINVPNRVLDLVKKSYGLTKYLEYYRLHEYDVWYNNITKAHTDWEKFLGPPFKVIKECASIEAGLQLMKACTQPFIVRNCVNSNGFDIDVALLRKEFSEDNNILSWYETPTELFNEKRNLGLSLLTD